MNTEDRELIMCFYLLSQYIYYQNRNTCNLEEPFTFILQSVIHKKKNLLKYKADQNVNKQLTTN